MSKSGKTFKEKQNESLPPNISWPGVLEEKLTPSEDTTGKWVASTTSFERKGLRFGMDSSPASAEVKGSRQAEERETEKRQRQNRVERKSQTTTREGRACRKGPSPETQALVGGVEDTWPRCCHWKPCWGWLHWGLEPWLQIKKVTLHLHCTADRKRKTFFF